MQVVEYYPNLNRPIRNSGLAMIGPTVEYPAFGGNTNSACSIDLQLRKMIYTCGYAYWGDEGADFDGIVVTILTRGAYLPQPAYFISSTIDTSLMTLTSTPTTIALNYKGVIALSGYTIVIGW